MKRLSAIDARTTAATAALGVVGLLVALVVIGGTNLLTVALALLGVLLAMVAGVSLAAARQAGSRDDRRRAAPTPEHRVSVPLVDRHIDADTLSTFQPLRDHQRRQRER